MGKRLLKLPRRLFGYQASSVDQLIADRDSMLGVAEQRVRSAEARVAELEEELSRRSEDLEAVKSRLETGEPADPAAWSDGSHEVAEAEPEDQAASPAWIPPQLPVRPPPIGMADFDESVDDAAEVEEWPLPTVRPRTVEFVPPPEPSADFDPMPIGGEDHGWLSPAVKRWGTDEEDSSGPLARMNPWSTIEQGDEAWGGSEAMPVPTPEAPDGEPYWEHPQPDHAEAVEEQHGSEPEQLAEPERSADPEHLAEPEHVDEHPNEPPPGSVVPQLTPAYMSEELANVVKAAEESATRIIERAWESTRTQIAQVDRLWREVQEEIVRFAAWREHVDPMIATVQGYIEEARARIEQVPPRIQEALSPAAEALARVDEGMSEFARASDLPQLLGKMHAGVAKTIDTGDFTASTSDSPPGRESAFETPDEPPVDGATDVIETRADQAQDVAHLEQHQPRDAQEFGTNVEAHVNGGNRAHRGEDMDMANAIVHELRIINESGDPISSPDEP